LLFTPTIVKNYNNILGRLHGTARCASAGRGGVGLPGCLVANVNKLWLSADWSAAADER